MKRVINAIWVAVLIASSLTSFTLANRTARLLALIVSPVPADQRSLHWLVGRRAKVGLDEREVEQELQGLRALLGPPAPEIFRLMIQLKDNDLINAGATCDRLQWPQCDPVTLGKMRTVLDR